MRIVGIVILSIVVLGVLAAIAWAAYEHAQEYPLFDSVKNKKALGVLVALTWPVFIPLEVIFEIIKK